MLTTSSPAYLPGFGGHVATEAVPGALPKGRNSPQRPAFGLYTEQLSGTAFTMPRHENRRSWFYRLRPTADHRPFVAYHGAPRLRCEKEGALAPNRLRWDPIPDASAGTDFIDSLTTAVFNRAPQELEGVALHLYAANAERTDRVFFSADGELLFLPQQGRLELLTELGRIDLAPGQIAVVPRGVRFKVLLPDGSARGYLAENYGAPFRLPDLGPIGANGLANPRDFETPVAWFEDRDEPTEVIQKYGGKLWTTTLDHSPLDVVAWHGNLAPYRYDLSHFNVIGTVSFDHPDPSIFTVLTSPSGMVGRANADFVIFPPRWMVAEDTFRPPWFHRNVMSEFMGLIKGKYDAKPEGFVPGGFSLHNTMLPHGPDVDAFEGASNEQLAPKKLADTLAFMFETRFPQQVSAYAANVEQRQKSYTVYGRSLKRHFTPGKR